jgi:hypothetical protein
MNHRDALVELQSWGLNPADFPLVAERLEWAPLARSEEGFGHGTAHLTCRFILAQPFIDHLPEQIFFGPGQELDLGDQFGPHPMHAA